MVIWITGNSGAGKSTLAKKILKPGQIWLDGDAIRQQMVVGYDLTRQGRIRHNLNVAQWVKMLSSQGFDVIVSLICPYETLRTAVRRITGCQFIYIEYEGDDKVPDKPYEKPINPDHYLKRQAMPENYLTTLDAPGN